MHLRCVVCWTFEQRIYWNWYFSCHFGRIPLGEMLANRPIQINRSWPMQILSPFWQLTTTTDVKLRRDLRLKEIQGLNPLHRTWESWYVQLPTIDPCSDSSSLNCKKSHEEWFCNFYRNGIRNWLSWLQPTPNSVYLSTTLAETFVCRFPLKRWKHVQQLLFILPNPRLPSRQLVLGWVRIFTLARLPPTPLALQTGMQQ